MQFLSALKRFQMKKVMVSRHGNLFNRIKYDRFPCCIAMRRKSIYVTAAADCRCFCSGGGADNKRTVPVGLIEFDVSDEQQSHEDKTFDSPQSESEPPSRDSAPKTAKFTEYVVSPSSDCLVGVPSVPASSSSSSSSSSSPVYSAAYPSPWSVAGKWIRSAYFPAGYPKSVKRGYGKYCAWLFLQSAVGSASYVLSTNALLSAVGVGGGAGSTALSAAIAWTLKDGLGCLGVILYSSKFGSRFDVDTKRFRFRGDLAHNCGVGLELLTPLCPPLFVALAASANALKGVAGVIGGATRAAVNRSFALQCNLGDVTARIHSISLTAYLVGMGLGIGAHRAAAAALTVSPQTAAWLFFCAFAGVHLTASYQSMRCVNLDSLSAGRLSILCRHWWQQQQQLLQPVDGRVGAGENDLSVQTVNLLEPENDLSVQTVNLLEPIAWWDDARKSDLRDNVVYGVSVARMFDSASECRRALALFAGERFIAWPSRSGKVLVAVDSEATSQDLLRAAFLSSSIAARPDALETAVRLAQDQFEQFASALQRQGWELDHVLIPLGPTRIQKKKKKNEKE